MITFQHMMNINSASKRFVPQIYSTFTWLNSYFFKTLINILCNELDIQKCITLIYVFVTLYIHNVLGVMYLVRNYGQAKKKCYITFENIIWISNSYVLHHWTPLPLLELATATSSYDCGWRAVAFKHVLPKVLLPLLESVCIPTIKYVWSFLA